MSQRTSGPDLTDVDDEPKAAVAAADECVDDDDFITRVTFPEGTDTTIRCERQLPFRVTIHYREPEFEVRVGRREHPFRWTYAIDATDRQHAADAAIREFQATARLSSVSWRRDIVAVIAELATDDADGEPPARREPGADAP